MTKSRFAVLQFATTEDAKTNLDKAYSLIEKAKAVGAELAVLPELFASPYFPKVQDPKYFSLAQPVDNSDVLTFMQDAARKLKIMLIVSFFEKAGPCYFNSAVLVDTKGNLSTDIKGRKIYRKSHIPDGPGYQEKFYFTPGDTGFMVWKTPIGKIGCAICWDQWFPEAARAMTLMDADIICYPTAIGSEPSYPSLDTLETWQRVMQGHAAANRLPIIAANRVGAESDQGTALTFYGSSFITDQFGKIVAEAPRYDNGDVNQASGVICADFDFELIQEQRATWGFFGHRRPELYGDLLTLSGDALL